MGRIMRFMGSIGFARCHVFGSERPASDLGHSQAGPELSRPQIQILGKVRYAGPPINNCGKFFGRCTEDDHHPKWSNAYRL